MCLVLLFAMSSHFTTSKKCTGCAAAYLTQYQVEWAQLVREYSRREYSQPAALKLSRPLPCAHLVEVGLKLAITSQASSFRGDCIRSAIRNIV